MASTSAANTFHAFTAVTSFHLIVIFLCSLNVSGFNTEDTDAIGKKITFYPSSLMMSHNVRPLIFYSDTRLMHLITKLKAIPPGPLLTITNNCSIPHNDFFDSLLQSISSTQKVIHRLLSLSSFSNLLECDSYIRRYFTYSTGLASHMSCPRHYQPTLAACKTWALVNCQGISAHDDALVLCATPVFLVFYEQFMCL